MNTITIYGDNRHTKYTKERVACRGIIIKDGQILLSYEENTDQWFIPGGGIEGNESLEECCIREVAEETGYLIEIDKIYLPLMNIMKSGFFKIIILFVKLLVQQIKILLKEKLK